MRRLPRKFLTWLVLAGAVAAVFGHPEVGLRAVAKEVPPPPPLPAELAELVRDGQAWFEASPDERAAYGRWFRLAAESQRAQFQAVLRAQQARRHATLSAILGRIFDVLALACLGMLLLPFFWWRRAVGHRLTFCIRCLLATGLLVLLTFLFRGLLVTTVELSSSLTGLANPESAMLDAAFDEAEAELELWTSPRDAGGMPLGPTLADMEASESATFTSHLLDNMKYLDASALEPAMQLGHVVYKLLGIVPYVMPFLITGLFLLTTGFVFRGIAVMPTRALAGEARAGWGAVRLALGTFWRESLAVLAFAFSLLVPLVVMYLAVRYVGYAIVDTLIEQIRALVAYMGLLTSAPDQTRLTIGMLGVPLLLLMALAVFLVSSGLYLVWARRLTQMRFHQRVPLGAHGYWRRAWSRVFRIQWGAVLIIWFVMPQVLGWVGAAPYVTAEGALDSLFWRSLLAVLLLAVGFLVLGLHRDFGWFLRFRSNPGPLESDQGASAAAQAGARLGWRGLWRRRKPPN